MLMELPDKWSECSRTIPLESYPEAFAHWGDMIAVGVGSDVVLLDAITGIRTAVLSGNPGKISSLGFSHDGTLLVSKSKHEPVTLWDVQTGGAIRTFDCPATGAAISISPDGNTIALGVTGGTIYLWDVRTGKRHSVETDNGRTVNHIRFSPVDSKRFMSLSPNGTIQQWNIAGQQIGLSYKGGGEDLAYTLDGTRFISCGRGVATVQDSGSGAVVVKMKAPVSGHTSRCCFSHDGRFVAFSVENAIYIWDITIPGARLVGRLAAHTHLITSLAFPSYLISASTDKSVRLWPSSSFLADSKTAGHIAALHGSTPIKSVNLFAEDGTIVTSDESGVVKTWDLITGSCGTSFSTPAKGFRDTYMADDALILVWWEDQEQWYHIWDVGKNRLLQRFRSSFYRVEDVKASGDVGEGISEESRPPFHRLDDVKISGDGSKILGVCDKVVEVVSMQTGEIISRLEITVGWEGPFRLCLRGSQVGIDDLCRLGWDFGGWKVSDFGPLSNQLRLDLADPPPNQLRSDLADPLLNRDSLGLDRPVTRWIVDTVTGRRVFRLPERYINSSVQVLWGGQYLLIWSPSGEVVVVDFDHVVQSLPTALSAAFSRLATLL